MARKRHISTNNSGKIPKMVFTSGGGKYAPGTALYWHATRRACSLLSVASVVRGSGLCARRGLPLWLAPELKRPQEATAEQALQPVSSLKALSVVESALREMVACPKSQESHHP